MLHWLALAGAITLEIAGTVSMKLSHGFTRPLPSVLLAQRGDVLLLSLPGSAPAVGICAGLNGLFLEPDGLASVPIQDCKMAWRI